jgi:TonB family protein
MMPAFSRHLVLAAVLAACAVPAFADCPKPTYPRQALRHRAQGMTIVAYRLQPDGSVDRTVLINSSGYPDLDRVAQETLARCDFRQAVEDGQPAGKWYPAVYPWVLADDPEMRQLKRKLLAAAGSDPVARYQLSLLMARGARSDYEQRQATDLLRGAAEQGVPHAQFDLGHRYETGSGVDADRDEAMRWYEKAAAQGDVLALQRLNKGEQAVAN